MMKKYIMKFDGTEYRFLSNFHPSELILTRLPLDEDSTEPLSYPSVEHAYQAAKTFDFEDREAIRTASHAGATKRLGKNVALRDDWDNIKDVIMLNLLRVKFSDANPELRQKLLDTEYDHLVEGNTWHDCHFGVCTCVACGSVGKNRLGELLMTVRGELQDDWDEWKEWK